MLTSDICVEWNALYIDLLVIIENRPYPTEDNPLTIASTK